MLTVSNAIFIFLFTPRVRRDLSNFMCQVMEISIRNGTSNTIPVLNVSAKYWKDFDVIISVKFYLFDRLFI